MLGETIELRKRLRKTLRELLTDIEYVRRSLKIYKYSQRERQYWTDKVKELEKDVRKNEDIYKGIIKNNETETEANTFF